MEDLIECEYCSRIWDGNAQCPCRMYDSSDEESEEINLFALRSAKRAFLLASFNMALSPRFDL